MSWRLDYTPHIWPAVASMAVIAVLAIYGWRRRSLPGALPFVALTVCGSQWVLGSALELASRDLAAKIFWATFQIGWQIPTATVGLWFALEYADARSWLVRRNLVLSAIPPILWLLFALTNNTYHILWSGLSYRGSIHFVYNTGGWIFMGYMLSVATATMLVFARLFFISPLHRVPVAICLCGQIVSRAVYGLKTAGAIPAGPMDPMVLSFNFTAAMYALALFRFRLFNLLPIARGTVIDQMREGMLVLDSDGRIMDLNPAAQQILGVSAACARGTGIADLLPGCGLGEASEITLGAGDEMRHYAVRDSALDDRRGLRVGTLLLLNDVTAQRQAQAQLLEQQRALATLNERDRVARELHDTLGQVLGYIKMQAAVAEKHLDRCDVLEAKIRVARVAAAAQNAQNDVREYILGTRAGAPVTEPLVPALSDYLRQFSENYGIATDLRVSPEMAELVFEPMAGAQLLRIIQEALTNVRKHAEAARVDVRLGMRDGCAEAAVQDDGGGFDPAAVKPAGGHRFGLEVMRERAEEVGGAVQVHSAPGTGTRVVITLPIGKAAPESSAQSSWTAPDPVV